jgi:hypothetical protein
VSSAPIASRAEGGDPEREALLVDSIGPALLVVLDTLNPAERLVFVLHDMFGVRFDEIAPIVGRSPIASASSTWPSSTLEAGGREGGAVALHYAGGHPKRVAGLLLADI